jgi:hypothetical protein
MKAISPVDKHLLYYRDKRIIDWTMSLYPNAMLIGSKKTTSRKETLAEICMERNCLVIDCDVIPHTVEKIRHPGDAIYVFRSAKPKYGSVILENGIVVGASEAANLSEIKCSGAYYIASMSDMLHKMQDDNSIASGMLGAKAVYEDTFIRLGDVEDYYEAL